MIGRPGITPFAANRITDNDPRNAFYLIFDKETLADIRQHTNREGRCVFGEEFSEVNESEMEAFVGLLILRGVYRGSRESTEELWSEDGRKDFRAGMSFNRFRMIRRLLRFDNKATRQSRLRNDPLAAIRLLIESFNNNSKLCYVASESCTVDEQLYPFHGRCRNVQYIPSKPAKYGLKFWLIADSNTFYCFHIEMYTGKTERPDGRSVGEDILLRLTEFLRNSGRNITTDNFFTSLSLALELRTRGLSLVGTIRKTRRDLPASSANSKDLALNESRCIFLKMASCC